MISSNLRQALRTHGFAKLAAGVHAARGEAWIDPARLGADVGASLAHCVEVTAAKTAADEYNARVTREGLEAYAHLTGAR